ncbi:guanylate-binding protein 1-like [Branchiostoma floridae]|uniref:Guanylate-binding protein 1-like n=1 Tax=Branchiostoma floridae TaxID=7739 RepID=A0A9J7LY91_BRAFL|nr:guanylate-binding protein 1-like [Branchiostoma floridae]
MSGLHSKHGFKVEALKPKAGGKAVHGSAIPLILPNDLEYNVSTGAVEKVQGARRETLQVVPEALDLLEGIEQPVSALAICGPCRSGKSYILSRLLGTADAFELGHRMDPQTFGIWMGTSVLRGKDFTIVLLDTEGIDAAGASAKQDASILVMTILLSSLLIYNSLNVPYKGDLEKMQCFIKLAKGITVKKGEKTQMSAFREFFPDFLWLLRDVSLMITDQDGVDMDPSEYLKTRVLGRQGEDDFDESTSDKVGRAILTFFSSVECATLERPSEKKEVMNNIAQHTGNLNPEFNKGVEDLIERLLLKSRAKRGYDKGSTVSGVALSIMAKQYVEAVNDPKAIPALDNTWKNTIQLMRSRAIEEVVVEYKQQMQAQVAAASKNGQIPLESAENNGKSSSQPSLMDLHHQLFKVVTDMLLEKVGHLGISSGNLGNENKIVVDEMQKRLVQREERSVDYVAADGTIKKQKGFVVTGGELYHFIQANKELSKVFCQKLFESLFDPIRKCVETPPPHYDFQQLMGELASARQQYSEQARGPEKWVVLQEMTKNFEKLKANFEKIKGYQKKLMQEQQKAQEAELQAREKAREVKQLFDQQQDMQKAHQETLQKMDQQHREQMEKVRQDEAERRQQEEQKYRDLQNAQMEQYATMAREFNEKSSSQMQDLMMRMQEQQADMNKQMMDLVKAIKDTPPPVVNVPSPSRCSIM